MMTDDDGKTPPEAPDDTDTSVPASADNDLTNLPPMPLTLGTEGQEVSLAEVRGGRGFLHRLAEMGLTRGVRFRIIKKGSPGPFIIALRDTRLMLGHGMVRRIFVRPV